MCIRDSDGASYRSQMLKKDTKEFCKVITLILYFGNNHWKEDKELREVINHESGKEDLFQNYKTIENYKPIKHVDEMLKFMRIFAEDDRFLQLDLKKNKKGEVTMCTILDAVEQKGIIQGKSIGENAILKLVKILSVSYTHLDVYKRQSLTRSITY